MAGAAGKHRCVILRRSARWCSGWRNQCRPTCRLADRHGTDSQPGVDPEDRPGHPRSWPLTRSRNGINRPLNGRLPQLHNPAVFATHINFQRVPTVDTSNPLSAKAIPSLDESFVVIRFRGIKNVDFPYLLSMIQGSFMSRHNTLVVPGGKMSFAMELIMRPLIQQLIETGKIG